MFGKNPIRKREYNDDGKLAVQEVFYTLQGEGPYAGMPAVFVRLAGCNLACTFCDTEFESKIDNRMPVVDVAEEVSALALERDFPMRLVVLTGGEPLRQRVVGLVQLLSERGIKVQIETAGTLWDDELAPYIEEGHLELVCSPKTPKIHPMIVRWCLHYKYIISAEDQSSLDGLPTYSTQRMGLPAAESNIWRPWAVSENCGVGSTIWVSPCDEHDPHLNIANTVAARDAALKYGYRLTLQMHKLVNLP